MLGQLLCPILVNNAKTDAAVKRRLYAARSISRIVERRQNVHSSDLPNIRIGSSFVPDSCSGPVTGVDNGCFGEREQSCSNAVNESAMVTTRKVGATYRAEE